MTTDGTPSGGGGAIRGKLVKFNTEGRFFCGDADVTGGEFAVTGVLTCWLRWGDDGKPAEIRITQPGEDHPQRQDLPDQDEHNWPLGPDGKRADPWQDTRYLYLVAPTTAVEATFSTRSYGGHRAVADLKRQIATMRRVHPKAAPIIRLDAERMRTKFGPKPKPLFTVIDWRGPETARIEPAPPAASEDDGSPWSPGPSDELIPV